MKVTRSLAAVGAAVVLAFGAGATVQAMGGQSERPLATATQTDVYQEVNEAYSAAIKPNTFHNQYGSWSPYSDGLSVMVESPNTYTGDDFSEFEFKDLQGNSINLTQGTTFEVEITNNSKYKLKASDFQVEATQVNGQNTQDLSTLRVFFVDEGHPETLAPGETTRTTLVYRTDLSRMSGETIVSVTPSSDYLPTTFGN